MRLFYSAALVLAATTISISAASQEDLPQSVQRTIELECSEYDGTVLFSECKKQSLTAYESWKHFTSDPEFEKISEIVSSCSVDWPGYIMRVECVTIESKALVRMNDLVNIHGIEVSVIKQAVDACEHTQDMGYSILEMCLREQVVGITGKPLP